MNAQTQIRRLRAELGTSPTVSLRFIAARLGKRNYGLPRLRRYVTLLIEECGFPPPFPTLVTGKKGEADRLELGVAADSAWQREPVEAWLEDFLPPANAAALDARAEAAAAEAMDQAAERLRLVGGRP